MNDDSEYDGRDNDTKTVMQKHSGDPRTRLREAGGDDKCRGRNAGEDKEEAFMNWNDGAEGHPKEDGGTNN